MALFKCKMCGGDLNITADEKIIECEFCGTTQTIPTSKDENLQGLFNRANILRMKSEFDKAEQLYEKIIEKDDTQAEAYWGLILCKYGIEYVEDPETFKRIPTCHRTSFDSIIADEDYKSALNYADSVQRGIYEAEAKEIDRIQKGILELSQKEEPYDVFICYKEADNDGKRTQDSVIANDIYHQLTQEGLKVFYAAITLENKLGTAYEPYIFAALNSAIVMLVIGTKPEYFNAVWVKNEWSRFLKLIQKDRTKLLIPCYRDMDAYELPEEFAHLQAQDMSKIGFINDIVRGIKKVVNLDEQNNAVAKETIIQSGNANIDPLLKRAFMFLEDGNWKSAEEYCEKVLDIDPECAEAYLGKLMAETKSKNVADIGSSIMESKVSIGSGKYIIENCFNKLDFIKYVREILGLGLKEAKEFVEHEPVIMDIPDAYLNDIKKICNLTLSARTVTDITSPIRANKNYEKFIRFASKERADEINTYIVSWEKKKRDKELEDLYTKAVHKMNAATTEEELKEAISIFESISGYKDSNSLLPECEKMAMEKTYIEAKDMMDWEGIDNYEKAAKLFNEIINYKDSKQLKEKCLKKVEECKAEIERQLKEKKQREEQERLEREKQVKEEKVRKEQERIEKEKQEQAKLEEKARIAERNKKITIIGSVAAVIVTVFVVILNTVIIPNNKYNKAIKLIENEEYQEAYDILSNLVHKDSAEKAEEIKNVLMPTKELTELCGEAFVEKYVENGKITFGSYEQDNNTSNGKEKITWKLVAKESKRVYVVSEYALSYGEFKEYDASFEGTPSWFNSSIRNWLNNDFYNDAFTDQEKKEIATINYINSNGEQTGDYDNITLLSLQEVEKFITITKDRTCTPTVYASSTGGGFAEEPNENTAWWLRTKGDHLDHAAIINEDGYNGSHNVSSVDAVRPALWISLSDN